MIQVISLTDVMYFFFQSYAKSNISSLHAYFLETLILKH